MRSTEDGMGDRSPMMGRTLFIDAGRCIGCQACVAACRECDSHRGKSMIHLDYLEPGHSAAAMPTVCMHCEDPIAPCAQVCPADAILVGPDGVVHEAAKERCIACGNCVHACPFGVPEGEAVRFGYPTDGDPALAIRLPTGELVAYSAVCTHLACAILWVEESGHLECPCHEGLFQPQTGEVVAGPPPRPLPRILLEEREDGIWATGVA